MHEQFLGACGPRGAAREGIGLGRRWAIATVAWVGFCGGALEGAAPANDAFGAAVAMGSGTNWQATGSNSGATKEGGEPSPSAWADAQASVWWGWQAPSDARVEIHTFGSSFDTVLGVWTGASVTGLVEVASNNDAGRPQSKVTFVASGGTSYRIAVYGRGAARGSVRLSLAATPRAANDDVADAIDLGSAALATASADNFGATVEGWTNEPHASLWWKWRAPANGRCAASLTAEGFSGALAAYQYEPHSSNLVAVASGAGSLNFRIFPSELYYFAAGGDAPGQEGPLGLRVQHTTTPTSGGGFDMFDGSAYIGAAGHWSTNASNTGATLEPGEPNPLDRGGASVWFTWTEPADYEGWIVIDTIGSDFDTILALYEGSELSGLYEEEVNDDCGAGAVGLASRIVLWVDSVWDWQDTHQIAVHGYRGDQGALSLNIWAPSAPPNDTWTNATELGSQTLVQDEIGTVIGATDENVGGWSLDETVWYRWTAPANGRMTLVTRATFSSVIWLFVDQGGDPAYVMRTGSGADAGERTMDFDVDAGVTYYVAIEKDWGEIPDDFLLNLEFIARPLNDEWTGAIDLGNHAGLADISGTLLLATDDASFPHDLPDRAVWYRWTAPSNGTLFVDCNSNGFDHDIDVFAAPTGTGPEHWSEVFADNSFDVIGGINYFIAVGYDWYYGDSDSEPSFDFDIRLIPNDRWSDALHLGSVTNLLFYADNTGAVSESSPWNNVPEWSLWYSWLAPSDGVLHAMMTGANSFPSRTKLYHAHTNEFDEFELEDLNYGDPHAGVQQGEMYYFALGSESAWYYYDRGPFAFAFELNEFAANDSWTNAMPISVDGHTEIAARNWNATQDEIEEWGQVGPDASLWFVWQPLVDGWCSIENAGGAGELEWLSYAVCRLDGDQLSVISSWQDADGEQGRLFVRADEVYYIAVGGGGRYESDPQRGDLRFAVGFDPESPPPPTNDNFTNATDLGEGIWARAEGHNVGATQESGEPTGPVTGSIWWRWRAPRSGRAHVADCRGRHFEVFTGASVSALSPATISWVSDPWLNQSGRSWNVIGGETYYIRPQLWEWEEGEVLFHLRLEDVANDMFVNAAPLGSGTGLVAFGRNSGASREAGERTGWYSSIWWMWQAPTDGMARLSREDTSEDAYPYLSVLSGGTVSGPRLLDQTRTSWPEHPAAMVPVRAGSNYWLAIHTLDQYANTGPVKLNIEMMGPAMHDNFGEATSLGGATNVAVYGNNYYATREAGENPSLYRSVWCSWQAPRDGGLWVSQIGSGYFARVSILEGANLPALVLLGQSGDGQWLSNNVYSSSAWVPVLGGSNYLIAAHTSDSYSFGGDLMLNVGFIDFHSNDYFADALWLGSATGTVATVDNRIATWEPGEPTNTYYNASGWNRSVWYQWEAPTSGIVRVGLDGQPYHAPGGISVLQGTAISNLTLLGSADVSGSVDAPVIAGSNYWIAVYDQGYRRWTVPAAMNVVMLDTPSNDNLANAIDIGTSTVAVIAGDNSGATEEFGEPGGFGQGKRSVWYRWTSPLTGIAVIDTGEIEPEGAVYTQDGLLIGEPEITFSGWPSRSAFYVTSGQTYSITIRGVRTYDPALGCAYYRGGPFSLLLSASDPEVPGNDNFDAAAVIGGGIMDSWAYGTAVSYQTNGDNFGASIEEGEGDAVGWVGEKSVWYSWLAPGDGRLYFGVDGHDTFAGAYRGTDLSEVERVDQGVSWNYDDERFFDTLAGLEYRIGVFGGEDEDLAGGGPFNLSLRFIGRPTNDDFVGAVDLGSDGAVSSKGNNILATAEAGDPNYGGASVWWKWIAPSGQRVTVDATCDFDAVIRVFEGGDLLGLTPVAQSEGYWGYDPALGSDRFFPGSEGLIFNPVAGRAYYIAVDARYAGERGQIDLNLALAPTNDDLASSVDLGSSGSLLASGYNFGATGEDRPSKWRNGVWWRWKSPQTGDVTIDTGGSGFDVGLDIYRDTRDPWDGTLDPWWDLDPPRQSSLRLGANRTRVRFEAIRGEIYYFCFGGEAGERGPISFRVAVAPENDRFEKAFPITPIASISVTGATYGATSESGEPLSDAGQSVWWSWRAPSGGLVSLDTAGSDFDTVIGVFDGTNVAALARLRECDDATTNGTSRVAFFAQAGSNYHFRVHGSTPRDQGLVLLNLRTVPPATTPTGHTIWGRAYLEEASTFGLKAADQHFRAALESDPNHAEANLLGGVTRFVLLEQEAAFESLLTAMGVVIITNDLYRPEYSYESDTNGIPIPSAAANTAMPLDYVRNHVEPRIAEVRAMWDKVTDPGFRAFLSDAETGTAFCQLDYGDVLMLRGLPPAMKSVWALIDTYDLAASLETACQMVRDGQFSAQFVVDAFQSMLEFRDSGRREEFRSEFLAAHAAYEAASNYIRNLRTTSAPGSHLFSLERMGAEFEEEQRVRDYAQDAADSLNGAVVSVEGEHVALSDLVNTPSSIRDFIPELVTNKVVAFSTPDVTFGGAWRNGSHLKIHDVLRSNDLLFELSSFSAWASRFLAHLPEAQRGRGANPDNDPLNNLMEYAFDLDPMNPNVAAEFAMPDLVRVTGEGAGHYLALTFVRRVDTGSLRYIVAVSDDLVNWDRTEAQVESWGPARPSGDGVTEQVTYRLKPDVGISSKKFLRLEVVEIP